MSDVKAELAESKNMGLEEAYIDEYWAYRQHVHTLLAWGYADSRHRVQSKHEEPDITGFIAEAIQDRLDNPDSLPWCDQIGIKDDPPIPGGGRTGHGRWRPDLILESKERRPRAKYHFEAKRLRKLQSKHDRYTGKSIVIHHVLLDYCITTPSDPTAVDGPLLKDNMGKLEVGKQ